MTIKLPADLDRYVQDKIESGRYESPDAVIAEALTVLRNVERARPGAQDDLRREIDLGLKDLEEGRVSEWSLEEMEQLQAVRLMKEREEKLAWLRREIQIGIDELDRGKGEPFEVEHLKAELERKYGDNR